MRAGSLSAGRARGLAPALLWIGGLGAALVVARAALRGIHVPGHAALPALFALVLAAARVRVPGAALAVALPAWAGSALGLLAGPGGAASLLLAALAVEVAAFLAPGFARSVAASAAVGAAAGALRFVPDLPVLLGGIGGIGGIGGFGGLPDTGAPVLLSVAGHALFGALGAALVPLLFYRFDRSRRSRHG
jgi:hypothetical protein